MVKQVIIARTDLDMSSGRMPSQVAHASIAVFLDMGKWDGDNFTLKNVDKDIQYWMKKSFTKVVLKVHSEEELVKLQELAKGLKLPSAMIEDDVMGRVEKTALAIGPALVEDIDAITGKLFLF